MWIIVLLAVLGPIIGSLIGILKKPSEIFMYNMLAFAAGVMLAISFLQLIPESIQLSSPLIAILGIIAGTLFMFLLDKTLPHVHKEFGTVEPGSTLKRTSLYLIVGIFLHNFPEGMAIAIGAVADNNISLAIALAIAIHNIPEGICTSAPYYYCTKDKKKAFLISSLTALPIIIGYYVSYYLFTIVPIGFAGFMIAATAGIMIYICSDEIIPTSCCFKHHSTIFSLMAGIILVMILGLI